MLIESYIHSLEPPFLALELLNEYLLDEVRFNYGSIKKGDDENSLDKILAISYANKALIEYLQNGREEIRKTVNDSYDELLREEI